MWCHLDSSLHRDPEKVISQKVFSQSGRIELS